jgi:RNA polymerase sigma factor (sigma-70 family)
VREDQTESQAQRFEALWEQLSPRVMAYALRHVDRDTAQDVVSETFLVAWRRPDAVPDDPLPWLLVVARNSIANQRRSLHRQGRLATALERLREVAEPASAADVLAVDRANVLAVLAALTVKEREALLLTAWDGLSPEQAATVAGCSARTFHVRLFRARRRLNANLDADDPRPTADVTSRLPLSSGDAS